MLALGIGGWLAVCSIFSPMHFSRASCSCAAARSFTPFTPMRCHSWWPAQKDALDRLHDADWMHGDCGSRHSRSYWLSAFIPRIAFWPKLGRFMPTTALGVRSSSARQPWVPPSRHLHVPLVVPNVCRTPRDAARYDHAHESPPIMYAPLIIISVFAIASAGPHVSHPRISAGAGRLCGPMVPQFPNGRCFPRNRPRTPCS